MLKLGRGVISALDAQSYLAIPCTCKFESNCKITLQACQLSPIHLTQSLHLSRSASISTRRAKFAKQATASFALRQIESSAKDSVQVRHARAVLLGCILQQTTCMMCNCKCTAQITAHVLCSDNVKDLDHAELLHLLHTTAPPAHTSGQSDSQPCSGDSQLQFLCGVSQLQSLCCTRFRQVHLLAYTISELACSAACADWLLD